jgi:hypothetical protein
MSAFPLLKTLLWVIWIVSMGWLIRFEAFPQWFEETARGYETLTHDLPALRDSWMKVFAGEEHVGYVHSATQVQEQDGQEQLFMESRLVLNLRLTEERRVLYLDTQVTLDGNARFLRSRLWGSITGLLQGEMSLTPTETPNRFRLDLDLKIANVPDVSFSRTVEVPPDVIVASPLLDNGFRSLRPGQTLRFRTLDPFSADGSTRMLVLRGEDGADWNDVEMDGEILEVRKVSATLGEITVTAWLDSYGRTLRQETPFGLTLMLSDARKAVEVPEDAALDFQQLLQHSPLSPYSNLPVNL